MRKNDIFVLYSVRSYILVKNPPQKETYLPTPVGVERLGDCFAIHLSITISSLWDYFKSLYQRTEVKRLNLTVINQKAASNEGEGYEKEHLFYLQV
jgi:hypothetical protein